MGVLSSKTTPAHHELLDNRDTTENVKKKATRMHVILLHVLLKRYGAQRHPKLESFETLMKSRLLTEVTYVPPSCTIIYVSHEWVGTDHPDPHGDQIYHLILLLERLQRGDVDRTDMDIVHSTLCTSV